MDHLFIPQPYASMIVKGLRTVVADNRFSRNQRIYINATEPVFDPDTPLEWRQEVINQQLFGNLEDTQDLPVNQCIGFADVLAPVGTDTSKWKRPGELSMYLYNAHVFDTPQPIAKRNRFDAEDIPSYCFHESRVHVVDHDNELVLPVNELLYEIASQGGTVNFELSGLISVYTLFDEGSLKEFEKFTLICGSRSKTFLWNDGCEDVWEQDPETDELVLYPSVFNASGKAPRVKLHLSCRYPIVDFLH